MTKKEQKQGRNPEMKNLAKGKATRKKIIKAARQVFARLPYNAASIRMIANQGGFKHPLVHHYFSSKAELFQIVAQQLYGEYVAVSTSWSEGVMGMGLKKGLSTTVSRVVDDCFANPDALMCAMQNIAHGVRMEDIPGSSLFPEFWQEIERVFKQILSPYAPDEYVRMWMLGFHIIVFNCIGAPHYHAQVMGMDPKSHEYRQWVKDTMMFLFYPSFKTLVFAGPKDEKPKTWKIRPVDTGADQDLAKDSENLRKGEIMRQKILVAARKVFTHRPYNTASIRMIASQGGFDFTLIHHYFSSKAELFETVANQIFKEILSASVSWLEGLDRMAAMQGLNVLLDRGLNYCFENPDSLYGLMQNIAQIDKLEDIPGFAYLPQFHIETQIAPRQAANFEISDKQVRMFSFGAYMAAYNCVGAPVFPAQVVGLSPDSRQYRQWVKDFVMFLLLPVLMEIAGDDS